MANELQSFNQLIRERIESLKSGESSNMRQPCIARAFKYTCAWRSGSNRCKRRFFRTRALETHNLSQVPQTGLACRTIQCASCRIGPRTEGDDEVVRTGHTPGQRFVA